MARQASAHVIMRMEDLDVGRAKPESVQQAYDDLRWLGMDWDSEAVQSQRVSVYRAAIERLWAKDAIYPCTCSRAQIAAVVAASASAPHAGDPNVRYPGTCAGRDRAAMGGGASDDVAVKTGGAVCWRLRVPRGEIAFDDLIAGPQRFDTAGESGDFPLTRFDNTPAYQLACVVDDHAMDIDMVVRGDDLLSSTPRQICLYRAMEWQPPRFAHVPLVVGPDGKRLAKRHGESRIAQFRDAGVTPEKIVGWVAWRSGQIDRPREISAAEMVARFDLARLPRERVVLTPDDLAWLR
jgi:glutamyl-tRNA synthetase